MRWRGEIGGESSGRGVGGGERLVIALPGALLALAVEVSFWEPHQFQAKAGSVGPLVGKAELAAPSTFGGMGKGGFFLFLMPQRTAFKLVFGK